MVNVDRDTPMLLPPDLRDWIAKNDFARFILEAVELSGTQGAAINERGTGSEQYPVTMMLALLIYCYASGIFSSRRVERATFESIAVRYICGNHHPDHDTIAYFRRQNGALFKRCFASVVELAREAGLLKLAAISIDGTRMAGAGSRRSVRTLDQIEEELRQLESQGAELLEQAEAADRSDRDAGGTQLPGELADPGQRREKLLAAKARIEERRRQAQEAGKEDGPRSARRTSKASISEPESRLLSGNQGGSVQGYNAQVAADAGKSGLIVGEYLSDEPTDYGLAEAGVVCVVPEAGRPQDALVVLVDKGYENSELFARTERDHHVMVLCPLRERPNTKEGSSHRGAQRQRIYELREKMKARLAEPQLKKLYQRRRVTVEPVFARIKRHIGFTRLRCWGHRAASAEWTLVCLAHNLRMLNGKMALRPA
jgi:transposase